jgi:hypothetical protein
MQFDREVPTIRRNLVPLFSSPPTMKMEAVVLSETFEFAVLHGFTSKKAVTFMPMNSERREAPP